MKSYPTVNVHVEYRRANQVYEDVLGNVVDLGLVAYPSQGRQAGNRPAAQGAAGADLPSAASVRQDRRPSSSRRSPARNSSASSRTSPRARRWTRILKEHGVEVKHVMEFDNIETVKRAVEIDAGVSIVPAGHRRAGSRQADPGRRADRRRRVLTGRWPPFTRRTRCSRPAMKQFLAILKDAI